MSNTEEKKEEAWEYLDKLIRTKQLVELHTHLLGMGSSDFWVSRIIRTYLPRVCMGQFTEEEKLKKHLKDLLKLQLSSLPPKRTYPIDKFLFNLDRPSGHIKDNYTDFTVDDEVLDFLEDQGEKFSNLCGISTSNLGGGIWDQQQSQKK
jgi:hypothetical protein